MAVFEGRLDSTKGLRFAIVTARFNDLITEKLLNACKDSLKRHGLDVGDESDQVDYAWVPGCFDMPVVAYRMALTRRYDAIICLGAVIKGQTPHFDYVSKKVSDGIAQVMMQTGVPVVFGVLTTDTMQQALERAGIKENKGWSFGMDAIEMASLVKALPPLSLGDTSSLMTSEGKLLPDRSNF
jgi:6,7-dimethyl-8-ribityllumazine synthase